jgi:hypothetical protein
MKIVSYNLQQGGKDWHQWSRVIEALAPDLLLAQESYSPQNYQPFSSHSDLIHQTAWCAGAGAKWGSAIYIRQGRLRPPVPRCIPRLLDRGRSRGLSLA